MEENKAGLDSDFGETSLATRSEKHVLGRRSSNCTGHELATSSHVQATAERPVKVGADLDMRLGLERSTAQALWMVF